jgi:hypothetical protein
LSKRFGVIEQTYEEPPFKDQMKELDKLQIKTPQVSALR